MGCLVELGRLIFGFWRFAVWFTPRLLRVIWEAFKFVAVALIALFRGFGPTAKDMADYWTKRYFVFGNNTPPYSEFVWWVFYICAIITLILGWILSSYLTIWLLKRIF